MEHMEQRMQSELPLLTEYRGPAAVDEAVILGFGDDEEEGIKAAIVWAWENRRVKKMSQRRAAELIGLTNSHLSNILAKEKHLPAQKIPAFEWVVGNTAVRQTIDRFDAIRKSVLFDRTARIITAHMMQMQDRAA